MNTLALNRSRRPAPANWGGSNYRAVLKKPHVYTFPDGRKASCERVYPGTAKKQMAIKFAQVKGLAVIRAQIGPINMITSRPDWVVMTHESAASGGFRAISMDMWDFSVYVAEEKYSNDDH